jgi:hypothetical protein
VKKNADQCLHSCESGAATVYPGVIVEVGFSDSGRKAKRDVRLWLENSETEVPHIQTIHSLFEGQNGYLSESGH